MSFPKPEEGSDAYLFTACDGDNEAAPHTVFYRAADAELAESLCRLCEREYGDAASFFHRPSSSFSPDEQVLFDEAIDDLAIYDDPDPGIYDPPPSRQTMLRAFYARRAERWAEMLWASRPMNAASQNTDESPLTDDVLLQVCHTSTEDKRVTPQWMADLRLVVSLVATCRDSKQVGLEHALTMLAGCIGQLPQFHPIHLPFGYDGPTITSHHWMDRDALTDGQRAVACALLKAGEDGLTRDGLEAVRSGARQILRRLKKDADWNQVIIMPGQTNGR